MNEPVELPVIRIDSKVRWSFIDFVELLHYRDLLFFMVWRGIKATYAQSVGGYAWAIIQPAAQILIFSVIFGGLLGLEGVSEDPYTLLTTIAIIPWGYMSSTLGGTSTALVTNAGMLKKIYFPRIIFLLNPVFANLVPFFVSLIVMAGVMIWYEVPVTSQFLLTPFLLLLMIFAPLSIGLWLSSLAVRFRDVGIAMNLVLRMLIYFVPVMYPSEKIPDEWRSYYVLNPFVGIIEGFQSALLGRPLMWDSLSTSIIVTVVFFVTGVFYFRRMERIIVDVV